MSDGFVLGAAGALVWLAVVLVLLRVSKRSPALIVVASAVLVYLVLLVASPAISHRLAFWPFSAAYGLLTLCVLMLFGALYKSVSLRMLGDLSKAAGHALPEQELLARYIEEDSFGRRVAILLEQGHAQRTAEGLELSSKGRRIAAAIDRLQQAFAIRASG
jgi:Ca2+/Na+ antiporter